jgi:hypothetical protein
MYMTILYAAIKIWCARIFDLGAMRNWREKMRTGEIELCPQETKLTRTLTQPVDFTQSAT